MIKLSLKRKLTLVSLPVICGLLITSVTSCAANQLPKQDNPAVVGGYTKQITFNAIGDYNISSYDSRVRTIAYVAKQNPSALVIIRYNSPPGQIFAKKLSQMLKQEGLKTDIIGYADKSSPLDVGAYIKFAALDSVVMPNNKESGVAPFSSGNNQVSSSPTSQTKINSLNSW